MKAEMASENRDDGDASSVDDDEDDDEKFGEEKEVGHN